ncbi:MAG TPA: hypothetical protein ENJ41_06040 [Oceanospirillales bacterium]|nr:hypothetical protein [Oceanospirillales bacterium]
MKRIVTLFDEKKRKMAQIQLFCNRFSILGQAPILLLFPGLLFGQSYSYVWGMHFPALIDPAEVCCFDYDNDSSLDDGLGDFLLTLQAQSNSDFQMGINDAILANTLVKAFDWQDMDLSLNSQAFSFRYLDAQILTPDLTLLQRRSGLSELILTPNQTGNIFTASANAGFINASADEITGLLNLQFDTTGGLTPLTLHNVMFAATLTDSPMNVEAGIYSNDITATNPEIVGGIKIGGILDSDEFLNVLDSQYRSCSCAGVDPNQPLITTQIFLGTIIVSCAQSNLTPENCPLNSFCSTVNNFCDNAIGLGTTFDIDSDNDGVKESYSVALRLGAAATRIDTIFLHGFE